MPPACSVSQNPFFLGYSSAIVTLLHRTSWSWTKFYEREEQLPRIGESPKYTAWPEETLLPSILRETSGFLLNPNSDTLQGPYLAIWSLFPLRQPPCPGRHHSHFSGNLEPAFASQTNHMSPLFPSYCCTPFFFFIKEPWHSFPIWTFTELPWKWLRQVWLTSFSKWENTEVFKIRSKIQTLKHSLLLHFWPSNLFMNLNLVNTIS